MTNSGEINTSYGTIRKNNNKNFKKIKLSKTGIGIISIAAASIILISSIAGLGEKGTNPIPEHQITTTITMQVEQGDTIYDIANKFYTDDCEGVYCSLANFQDAIKEQNDVHGSRITKGDILEIPVIVDKDNSYYLQIKQIQNMIADIEKNNLWVKYTVQYGDNITKIAGLASGSYSETQTIIGEIIDKNNIRKASLLSEGQEIWIMNPELGRLKIQLSDIEEQFKQSLIGNKKTKK